MQRQNRCEAHGGACVRGTELRGTEKIQNVCHLLYRGTANIIIVIYVFTPLSSNCEGGGRFCILV
jgi:hypothetical protein